MLPPFAQPTSIGQRYRVIQRLGGGAMGAVFLAMDEQRQERVAIKIPAASRHWRAAYERAVIKEIGILSALQHPNIVEILDSGQDAQLGPYIVMEFIEGMSVRQMMGNYPGERLPPEEAMRIVVGAAEALAYAHTRPQPIIHRDIKPDNILIRNVDKRIKVSDFGLAAVLTGRRAMTQWGTPDYIAPEQALGKGADARSDLYGLAATLYHMLTGIRPPPLGAQLPGRPSAYIQPGALHGDQLRRLDFLIISLLAYDPNARRPTHAADVAEELKAIQERRPAQFYPTPDDSAIFPALMTTVLPPVQQVARQPQTPQRQPVPLPPQQQPMMPRPAVPAPPQQPMAQRSLPPGPPPQPMMPHPLPPAPLPQPPVVQRPVVPEPQAWPAQPPPVQQARPQAPLPARPVPPSEQIVHQPPVAFPPPVRPAPQQAPLPVAPAGPQYPPPQVPGPSGTIPAPQAPAPPTQVVRPLPVWPALPQPAWPAPQPQWVAPPQPMAPQHWMAPPPPAAGVFQGAPPAQFRPARQEKARWEVLAGVVAGLVGASLFILSLNSLQGDGALTILVPLLLFWATGVGASLASPRGRRGRFAWLAVLMAVLTILVVLGVVQVLAPDAGGFFEVIILLARAIGALGGAILGALATWLAIKASGKDTGR